MKRVDSNEPLDPVEWAHEDAGAGVFAVDALRAVWKRKAIAAATFVAALALPVAWFFVSPYAHAAQQEILFGQELDADQRQAALSVGSGPGAVRVAADASGAAPDQIRLQAEILGSRTLLLTLEHRYRSTATTGLDAVTNLVRTEAPLSSRLQKPLSMTPRRFGSARIALLIAAGVLGLLAGATAACTLHRRDRRIASLAELEQVTGLPVLMLNEETTPHVS